MSNQFNRISDFESKKLKDRPEGVQKEWLIRFRTAFESGKLDHLVPADQRNILSWILHTLLDSGVRG